MTWKKSPLLALRATIVVAALNAHVHLEAQCPGLRPQFSWFNQDSAIVFVDQTGSMTGITYRMWYFGDGDSSEAVSPTHVYDTADVSTVTLVLQTEGCSYNLSTPVIHAGVNDNCHSQLSSTFSYTALGNNHLAFTDASDADGAFVLHLWSFGDDSTSWESDVEHFYIYPGAYDVAHAIGTVDSLFQTVCVAGHVERIFVDGNTSTCDSSLFLDLNVGLGLNPTLDAEAVLFNEDLAITNWVWDYGDGTSFIGTAYEHAYAYPGEYQLCVQVNAQDTIADDSCSARACATIVAEAVAVPEHAPMQQLRAWPIPFRDEVTLAGDAVRRGEPWQLLDALGRQVASGMMMHDDQERIQTPTLPAGVYILYTAGDAGVIAIRLTKQ